MRCFTPSYNHWYNIAKGHLSLKFPMVPYMETLYEDTIEDLTLAGRSGVSHRSIRFSLRLGTSFGGIGEKMLYDENLVGCIASEYSILKPKQVFIVEQEVMKGEEREEWKKMREGCAAPSGQEGPHPFPSCLKVQHISSLY